MSKNKWLIPVIIVLAILVLAGGYWAWQRYEQERLARQFLSGLTALGGGNVSDLQKWGETVNALGGMENYAETGGGEETQQTPEQNFNATEELQVDSAFVRMVNNEVGPLIKEVFGDEKISGFYGNYAGEGSGVVSFMVKRETVSGDLNKLSSALTSNGFTVVMSGVESNVGAISATKGSSQYAFNFDIGDQEVVVTVFSEVVPQ